MQRDPHVAVSIQDPDDPYRRVEIRGRVTEIEDDTGRRFIDSLAKTYKGEDTYNYDPPGTKRVIVHIAPEHVTTYGD